MVAELNEADAQSYFAKVQSLRNMNDVLSHAKACCNSNKQLIKELLQPQGSSSISLELNAQLSNLNGFVESVTALQERTRNTLELVRHHPAPLRCGPFADTKPCDRLVIL